MLAGRWAPLLCKHSAVFTQPVRSVWWKKIKVEVYPSLQERLEELDHTKDDPERYAPVDIGLPPPRKIKHQMAEVRLQRIQQQKALKEQARSQRKNLMLDLAEVEAEWATTVGPHHIRVLADHYAIFRHLYGNAFFLPRVPLTVHYDYDEEVVSPVYRGNTIKPSEASCEPSVQFPSKAEELWTLVLTSPDNNLLHNNLECLHWMVGNIPGGQVGSGELLCEYMRPVPPRGTGYHRYVFVLYKQHGHINFSQHIRQRSPSLKDRNFSTLDFYQELQDDLTPAGLCWFQADWDTSTTNFFHNVLKMKEPVYEYEFPEQYLAPQKHFPLRREFNIYMDLHRDPKEINKEILLERLERLNPLVREPPVPPFPNAEAIHQDTPSWQRKDIKRRRLGVGKYADLYRGYNRPRS